MRWHSEANAETSRGTEWCKNPIHQGDFLLDRDVHVTTGIGLLLGPGNTIARLSAYSVQLQKLLPPADTIDTTMRTKSGVIGIFSLSFGTSFTGYEFSIACKSGAANHSVFGPTVITAVKGKEEKRVVEDGKTDVPPELRKWGEALAAGKRDAKQKPVEALPDLELVSRTSDSRQSATILRSDGKVSDCVLQLREIDDDNTDS